MGMGSSTGTAHCVTLLRRITGVCRGRTDEEETDAR